MCGCGPVYFDTATMLPVLVTFGKFLEAGARTRASELLHGLEALLPASALRLAPGGVDEVGLDALRPGDRIRVRPGERVAVDGKILAGTSSIEEATFSGEFLPRHCGPGDRVLAGTVNGAGTLVVEAEATGSQLLLHGIVALVREAWGRPSQAERLAQRLASQFVPVLGLVAFGALLWWAMRGAPETALFSAISVLVVACPCTMGIATPLATSLAITRAARAGVIVRGGAVLERLAAVDLLFFDKTGTLTLGRPQLDEVCCYAPGLAPEELLGCLATLESASGHPLGQGIAAAARVHHSTGGELIEAKNHPGQGVSGAILWQGETREIAAGSESFVTPFLSRPAALPAPAGGAPGGATAHGAGFEPDPATLVQVCWNGELRGYLRLSDQVRSDAGACIGALARQGVSSLLLSGDRLAAASAVAGAVGISRVEAPRDPVQKLARINEEVASGRQVAMVGDGVNDAPALAAAPVGIALGAGTDLARQAGNVVLLADHLMQIPWLIALSRRTVGIVRGNFAWSFAYNTVALAAAAAGQLHPLLAALAMLLSSLTVLGNSLRITRFPEPPGDSPRGEG